MNRNHYVYQITNNMKYIGKRSCKCKIEEDTYMSSGKLIRRAISKYGIENFSKEILVVCKTEDEAFQKEKELIEKYDYCKSNEYYNIVEGGEGGNNFKRYTEE